MKLYPETKQSLIKILSTIVLPVMILAVLGVGFILAYNILKQGEASNAAVPEYDIDNQVGIEGTELYQNINQDKYGKVDTIEAAKKELLIRLKDDVPLYEIAMIANKYNMDILKRYRKEKPSFRLRLSSVTTEEPGEEPSIDINKTQAATTPETTEPEQDQPVPYNPNLPKSDGKLEQIWEELDGDPRIYCVGLNAIAYPGGSNWDGGYWPNDQHMNFPTKPGDKGELRSIGAHKAWKKLLDSNLPPGGDGENIWIAILDSGGDLDHPDLADNIARDENGESLGRSFVYCDPDIYDCNLAAQGGETGGDGIDNDNSGWIDEGTGHGVFVAGIAAEMGDNTTMAAGVGFNIKTLPVIICSLDGDYGCLFDSMIEGMNYAASIDKVKVISMSFGGHHYYQDVQDAVNNAWSAGKVIVAGAGNENTNKKFYPAALDNVIAVAGVVDAGGQKSYYSSYGDWVDISAIIDGIYSTKYDDDYGSYYGDEYETGGTSWAAPQVSGSVALLLSLYPNLSNKEAKTITIQRARTLFAERGLPQLGCGVLNVGDMLNSKAPIIESPKCITRFWLGEDIELKWKPLPGTQPDSYRLHYFKVGNDPLPPPFPPPFPPPKPDDGTALTETSWTLKSKDAETMGDGTWAWRVAAWFPNDSDNGMMYWTSPQTVFKHTGAQISNPKDGKIISAGEVFDWEDIANATNYVAHIDCDFFPPNPDPNPVKFGLLGYLISNNSSQSQHTLTTEEWNLLQFFAEKNPSGQPIECSWSVVGTRITDKYLWYYLELEKNQEFLVP